MIAQVKCPGDQDGKGCRYCQKKGLKCAYSYKEKPGPKGRKRQMQDGDGCGGGGAGGESGSPLMASSSSSVHLVRPAKKRKNASVGSSGTELAKTAILAGGNLDGAGDGDAATAGSSGTQLSQTAMEAGGNLDGAGGDSSASASNGGGGGVFGDSEVGVNSGKIFDDLTRWFMSVEFLYLDSYLGLSLSPV